MKLHYRELGQGKPVIVLHGVFGTSDNWITPAKILSEQYKLYLLDQRNHGQSPHSDEFNNSIMAEDLKDFIEAQNILKPVVIGHSMGGKVAMNFAVRYGHMIDKLIVADIAPKYYPPHHQKILQGLNSIDLKNLKTRQEADEQLARYESDISTRQFLLKNLYRNDNNEFAWRINLPVITEKINNVGEALGENVRVNIPTLFIRGGNSNYIKKEDEILIEKIFADVRIETIEGAGHWVHAEKGKEFGDLVKKFVG
ncbi:MAG: alpha/beta fold hydrolase [Cytophagaceae bacterium]|nr:alpha/beta fold hydrolase [Cytophagaceae bacterium]